MFTHTTVLLEEAVNMLDIKPNGVYVDATTGGGGHSSLILSKLTTGHLYCFDQDSFAFTKAKEKLDAVGKNYTFISANFVDIKKELSSLGINHIDGIIYDLGVSSFQLDIKERGFSYRLDAPLDMRMNQNQELSAYTIVNQYSFEQLCEILYRYGEEPFSKQIARKIEEVRKQKPIKTTLELVEVIRSALPAKVLRQKGHPAKQTFQALRIAVNDELRVFEKSLLDALEMLNSDGRAVVITFHSLEDRICKTIFKEKSTVFVPKGVPMVINEEASYEMISRKPILPSQEEIENNNRSHSAKMRVLRRK
ncbi:MAG: 16S rRNA (cytosine(1402)-N(4))-methyltransferase RsmH [Anaeroplasmataceae bacterium]|nr:16S rRNA (cytosine(1402)-N(4))-methyltransferase RsmH [Anaeroplasmataceae bacterium]